MDIAKLEAWWRRFIAGHVVDVRPILLPEQLRRYELRPGDRLLVTMPRQTPKVKATHIRQMLQDWAPDAPVVVVPDDVDVCVVREVEALNQ